MSRKNHSEAIGVSVVARAVGLSENQIRRLADDGTIKSRRDYSNRRVFDAAVIDALKVRAARIQNRQRA